MHVIKIVLSSLSKSIAFEANDKLYEFTRIPFGVKNGVAEFQRKMREFIEEENFKGAFSYVDITIAGHDQNVASFTDAIQRRKLTLNKSKTISFVEYIHILGYIVGNMNIRPNPKRMRALQDFPVPNKKNALRRALGMFAYYAKWISCFATKVRPLAEAKTFSRCKCIGCLCLA